MPDVERLTAQELVAKSRLNRAMCRAPESFSGTVEELAKTYVLQNLIKRPQVASFHELLVEYLESSDPLFLIRALGDTERGQIYRADSGGRFKATDNAPAWWIHFALFQEIRLPTASFATVIETLPTHFFEVASQVPESINAAGWHVAHIFAVKDRNTEYRKWNTRELVRRCVRNIHPCNYFLVPKTDWQIWGGNERVISYFANLYQELYGQIWTEFLSLSGADSAVLAKMSGSIGYQIGPKAVTSKPALREDPIREVPTGRIERNIAVSYTATRLAFKADLIEPLALSARFRVVTAVGTFEMSKAEFYSTFPNVVKSKSYREHRLYHYPSLPTAAEKFRVSSRTR